VDASPLPRALSSVTRRLSHSAIGGSRRVSPIRCSDSVVAASRHTAPATHLSAESSSIPALAESHTKDERSSSVPVFAESHTVPASEDREATHDRDSRSRHTAPAVRCSSAPATHLTVECDSQSLIAIFDSAQSSEAGALEDPPGSHKTVSTTPSTTRDHENSGPKRELNP